MLAQNDPGNRKEKAEEHTEKDPLGILGNNLARLNQIQRGK